MRRVLALAMTTALLLTVTSMVTGTGPATATTRERLPGLEQRARVVRDRFGINHVVARNDHDLFFLQGYVHAQDRLFQMDLSRRQAAGRRAELLGPDLLADDIQLRTVGIYRSAQRSLDAYSPDARAVLDAYTEGVNAWVAANPLPSEYAEVEVTSFEPWTALDSAAVGKLIAFGLSFDVDIFTQLDYDAYIAAGVAGGFDGAALWEQDVNRVEPFSDASTVPDATGTPAPNPPAPQDATRGAASVEATPSEPVDPRKQAAARWADEVRGLPSFAQLFDPARRGDTGSNEWGVTGDVTPSGRPIIANDPHLALDLPSTFYPIGLTSPSMEVTGIGFAGVPTVILGSNRNITWGATTNPLDVTDSYLEQVVEDPASPSGLSTVYEGRNEPVVEIPETFRANTRGNGVADDVDVVPAGTPVEGSQLGPVPEATFVVPRRNNGPLLLGAFSIQYTGFSGTRELETFLRWDRAEGLDDFREGLDFFDVGSQNWAYADRAGNLGYFSSAEAPLREDLQAGAVVGNPPWRLRDGTGGNEWLADPDPAPNQAVPYQVLPYEEMPQVLNPAEGFFVNANNDPAGTSLDNDPLNQTRPGGGIYYLNNGYDGFRGGRITERLRAELAGGGTVTRREMRDMQADVTLPDASFFLPYLTGAFDRAATSSTPALTGPATDPRVVEAIGRLRSWDGSAPTGVAEGYDAADDGGVLSAPSDEEVAASVAATIYSVWRGQFIAGSIDASLEAVGVSPPGDDQAIAGLRNLLEGFDQNQGIGVSGVDLFASATATTPEDRRDEVILGALSGALDLLSGEGFAPAFGGSTDQDDYRWGRLHRVTFDHPLGGDRSAPPAGGFATVEGLDGIATDGGFNTVDASGHNGRADEFDDFRFGGGPVRRFTGIGGPQGIRGETSLPGGASGLVESDQYVNLLGDWLTNETYPHELSTERFTPGATAITLFRP